MSIELEKFDGYQLLPDDVLVISARNTRSYVLVNQTRTIVYKHAPKFFIDNEFYFLDRLALSGFVPSPVCRLHDELISMPYIMNEQVTDPEKFMSFTDLVLGALAIAECRHGDLTKYAVLVSDNKPIIIDFSESRPMYSPIPDKRREGDRYWLRKTMGELCTTSGHKLSGI